MKQLSLLAASLMFSAGVLAGAADNVSVQDPYVRLAPPNAPATGAFMVIKNNGDKDVKVLKADNPVSKVTELHTHLNEGGVMKMRPVPSIDIKAKGEAVLKPGSLHVMLIDLKTPRSSARWQGACRLPWITSTDFGRFFRLTVEVCGQPAELD